MGAGSDKEHFMQDAGELYLVYKLQEAATKAGKHISSDVLEKESCFLKYCEERGVEKEFAESDYKKNVDAIIDDFFSNLLRECPESQFDFIDVEAEYRNKGKKGDFVIKFTDGREEISVSLKNYKKGFDRIQVCSGTWNSFINNFLFEKVGVGKYLTPSGKDTFQGSDTKKRNQYLQEMGYENLIPIYEQLDRMLSLIKEKYVRGERAEWWDNIKDDWKHDCVSLGTKAAGLVLQALKTLPSDVVKSRMIKQAGLNSEEELLLLGKKKYLFSLFDENYSKLLKRLNSKSCRIKYYIRGKNIVFSFSDDDGEILPVEIPFTLQKNGAWYCPPTRFSGTKRKATGKDKGRDFAWGQRRPGKSKELATSINTFIPLKETLAK